MTRQPEQLDGDCGGKHLKLGLAIIGIVLAICSSTLGACYLMVGGLEERVRRVEQNDAANATRFESIRETLQRLEKGLSSGRGSPGRTE